MSAPARLRYLLAALAAAALGADAPPPSAAQKAEAVQVTKSLQELAAATGPAKDVPKEKPKARPELTVEEVLKAAGRPARTVEKTTVDAAYVDALLDKTLIEAKTPAAKLTGDEEFVRRICLDVAGKLPTAEQVRSFVQSKNARKRADLVDYLLASPDYGKNWARYWRDVIRYRATPNNPGQVNFPSLEDWLAEQIDKNTPWDEVVRAMIAGTGETQKDGATVFAAAHNGQAVELAGEVSRVFMGVQIQCAECHDHPNDPWKREQFHQFAAFFGGVISKPNAKGGMATGIEVSDRPNAPNYRMPDLKDPKTQIPVAPRFFLADSDVPTPGRLTSHLRRELAASYVVGQDNPWFAKAFVNRVWGTLMGEGFYTPIDDLGPTRKAAAPEVIDALADAWQKGGYDVRWLFRTILNTRAYQREFRSTASAAGKTPFAANCASRLRADQIFDALAQALDLPQDLAAPKEQLKAAGKAARAAGKGQRGLINVLFGVDPSTPTEDILGTIPQALFMMNGPEINRAIQARPNTMLGQLLVTHPDDGDAINALYFKVLARRPNGEERATLGRYIAKHNNRPEAYEDILWSLINTTEFISRR